MELSSFDILGVKISAVDLQMACRWIEECILRHAKLYVCVVPVSTIVQCRKDKEYLEIVNRAGMTTPDGMPVVWLGKLAGNKIVQRVYGPDLLLAACRMGLRNGYKHYFYGATQEICLQLDEKLKEIFPSLNIVGKFSPPFRSLSFEEEQDVVNMINEAHPDVLWIGLGSPKQDFWMYHHRDKLNVPVMIGVGAAFDFIAGTKPQAPRWVQRIGMEWFFRLCCEPGRLWKRYLIGNTQFLCYLLQDWARRLINPCQKEQ